MKPSALDALLVSKSLLGEAKELIGFGDRHSSTAGIIILQDFVELVVLALLDERDVTNLESKSFDELLGELKKNKIPVIKSGTIKALNKQRVICKHYGQLSEPVSVVNYLSAAIQFTDAALLEVYGKCLTEVFATDLLADTQVKVYINQAISAAQDARYLEALCGLRQAFFESYEHQYCIYDVRNEDNQFSMALLLSLRGTKAPAWTKDKNWIAQNVKAPMDFVQVDYERMKSDCLEWGVSAVDVDNFRRLTPLVFELEKGVWHRDYHADYAANELSAENFNYCLDVLLSFVLGKQRHELKYKYPKLVKTAEPLTIYIGHPIYISPARASQIVTYVPADCHYKVIRYVTGFDASENWVYILIYPRQPAIGFDGHFWGYLLLE